MMEQSKFFDIELRIAELCDKAVACTDNKNFEASLKIYQQAIALLPEPKTEWNVYHLLYIALGEVYFFLGQYEQALTALNYGLPKSIGDAWFHLRLGQVQFELAHTEQAKENLLKAYIISGYGIFKIEDKKYFDFVKKHFGKIVELKDKVDTLHHQAIFYTQQEEFEEAIKLYEQAINLLPHPKTEWNAHLLYAALGELYFFMNQHEEALIALQNSLPQSLGNSWFHLRLGQVQFELGNIERAKDELARAFMGEGYEIFANEDKKYFEFVKTFLRPPLGQEWPVIEKPSTWFSKIKSFFN